MYMATPRIILRLMLPKLRPSQEPRSPSTCSWQVSLLFGTPPCGLPCQYKWMTSKTFLGRLISPPEVQQGSRASASQEPLLTVQRLLRHKGLVSRLSLSSFSLSLSLSLCFPRLCIGLRLGRRAGRYFVLHFIGAWTGMDFGGLPVEGCCRDIMWTKRTQNGPPISPESF